MIALIPIRRCLVQIFVLSATLLLAGCFVSEAPLIGPGNAVYPFQSMVLYDASGDEEDTATLARRGDVYVDLAGEDEGQYMLAAIDDDLYLAQMRVQDDTGKVSWIYGIVQFAGDEFFILSPLCRDAPEGALNSAGIGKGGDGNFCTISSLDQLEALARIVVGSDIERATFRILELVR